MKTQNVRLRRIGVVVLGLGALWVLSGAAHAHCDTMDGPVVKDAQSALAKGDVTPVLKWVPKDKEAEILAAFKKTLTVRGKGPEAQDLADTYFFETLVRIHRQSEGAPYTGLKPAGEPLEPGVAASDAALASGSADDLVKAATDAIAAGIRKRFAAAAAARSHANESVEAGRAFVAAYVEYVHYVEGVFTKADGGGHAHGEPPRATPAHSPAEPGGHRH